MKKLINYFISFVKEHFNLKIYVSFLLFCFVLIFVNYWIILEDRHVDGINNLFLRTLGFFGMHAFAFFGTLLLIRILSKKEMGWNLNKAFWLKSILAFLLLSFDRSLHLSHYISDFVSVHTYPFWRSITHNLQGVLVIIIPLLLFFFAFDRKSGFGFYGLRFRNNNFWPYWAMFAFMIVVVFLASYNEEIQKYYPVIKRVDIDLIARLYSFPKRAIILLYETAYLSDFLNVELFFRGLLVLGLMRFVGKDVVLAMAATYAVLHFGKPMIECISSVFGGFILGVLAYKGKNIWGGVFIHMGIALLMEIFGWWQM